MSSKTKKIVQSRIVSKQAGVSLIFFALILVIAGTTAIVAYLDSSSIKNERDKKTADVLADAKAALIGYVSKSPDISSLNRLPNPDLRVNSTFAEGIQAGSAGPENASLLGKFPWRSLGMPSIKDGYGECVWYAVSGNFKSNPPSSELLNWDTKGQIDVIDGNGNVLYESLAAIILSAGFPLSGQNRLNDDIGLGQCGGNYDAQNYLDTYDGDNAILGEVNYFPGSPNNRQAGNALNKRFVLAQNDHYNDRIITISIDDLFKPIVRRTDFKNTITTLMNDADFIEHLAEVVIDGGKGTAELKCNEAPNPAFCNNWKEMLLLTALSPPSLIEVDGESSLAVCSRVLIFSGQKTSAQSRVSSAEKSNPENYLENENLASFAVPIANDVNFKGSTVFEPTNPTADIIRCIE